MSIKIAVVMDPISSVNYKKDSTLAMLFAAQERSWDIYYIEQQNIFLSDGKSFANCNKIKVLEQEDHFFELSESLLMPLADFTFILMRKDPPFDMSYIYTTYLLEIAENSGAIVVNKPSSLRDCNEKVFATHFPQCCTPTLVSQNHKQLLDFVEENGEAIIKPLDGMGGESIFKLEAGHGNNNVIIETLTEHGNRLAMIQRFIPDVSKGDKRILLINGEPIPYGLARIPQGGDVRGNLAAGGKGVVEEINDRERWICEEIKPTLLDKGLIFVGIDVIGGFLTEINVTSPTCIREIDREKNTNIAGKLLDHLESLI